MNSVWLVIREMGLFPGDKEGVVQGVFDDEDKAIMHIAELRHQYKDDPRNKSMLNLMPEYRIDNYLVR